MATFEPEVEYSPIAYRVVSDDVTLGSLYEDLHSCYSEDDAVEAPPGLYPRRASAEAIGREMLDASIPRRAEKRVA